MFFSLFKRSKEMLKCATTASALDAPFESPLALDAPFESPLALDAPLSSDNLDERTSMGDRRVWGTEGCGGPKE